MNAPKHTALIATDRAPEAIGPYSQAVRHNGWVFTAGQLGLPPHGGALVGPDITAQTVQALENLEAVLHAAGASLATVIKTTVFLTDMADFGAMNAVYASRFAGHQPARSTVQVAALPLGAVVEIEAVAAVNS